MFTRALILVLLSITLVPAAPVEEKSSWTNHLKGWYNYITQKIQKAYQCAVNSINKVYNKAKAQIKAGASKLTKAALHSLEIATEKAKAAATRQIQTARDELEREIKNAVQILVKKGQEKIGNITDSYRHKLEEELLKYGLQLLDHVTG